MNICLIRHAESLPDENEVYCNDKDCPLTERGITQVKILGERLKEEFDFDFIYASPSKNAWDTAVILGKMLGLKPVPVPAFMEQRHGLFSGCKIEEVKTKFPKYFEEIEQDINQEFHPCGGELIRHVWARVGKRFDEIISNHLDEDSLCIISHELPINVIIGLAEGLPSPQNEKFKGHSIGKCSISLINMAEGSLFLVFKNDMNHFVYKGKYN